jgi:hypothetical protein
MAPDSVVNLGWDHSLGQTLLQNISVAIPLSNATYSFEKSFIHPFPKVQTSQFKSFERNTYFVIPLRSLFIFIVSSEFFYSIFESYCSLCNE